MAAETSHRIGTDEHHVAVWPHSRTGEEPVPVPGKGIVNFVAWNDLKDPGRGWACVVLDLAQCEELIRAIRDACAYVEANGRADAAR